MHAGSLIVITLGLLLVAAFAGIGWLSQQVVLAEDDTVELEGLPGQHHVWLVVAP